MQIEFKLLWETATVPKPMTPGAAGFDLYAHLPEQFRTLVPGGFDKIRCGFAMSMTQGFEAQVRPRSSLAALHGVTVLNAPGTIDADYRGEVGVILINHSKTPYVVRHGDRIAQMVFAPLASLSQLSVVRTLSKTDRGDGGFGSTGR